jgi:hypothetical protein
MTTLQKYTLTLLIVGAAASCSESFDPGSAQLMGTWYVDVDHDVGPGGQPGLVNPCRIRGAVIDVFELQGDTVLNSNVGGTSQCQVNGVWSPPIAYALPGITLVSYNKSSGAIEIRTDAG